MAESELATLRAEIADLNARLEATGLARDRAGEYGLQLLEEKNQLEQRLEELQNEYKFSKEELERTKEALAQFRHEHRNAALSELKTEQSLLEEREKLEEEFTQKVRFLESQVAKLQKELEILKNENERLRIEYSEVTERMETVESQRKELYLEVKELKEREQRLLNDNNELEEENINLQKQVSSLRSAQVEFEAMKMEVIRLAEDNEILQTEVEEHRQLKFFAETETEKALQTAQSEREQRLALKRELEHMRNNEQMSNLNSLYMGMSGAQTEEEKLKVLETSMVVDTEPTEPTDLFSEIHGAQLSKLKEENTKLSGEIEEFRLNVQRALGPLWQKLQITGLSDSGSNLETLKETIQEAINRLDEKLRSGVGDKAAEKRNEHIRSDLRQIILLAGVKNAQLAAARDRVIQLADFLGQFYGELTSGEKKAPELEKVQQIQKTLRSLIEKNAESEGKKEPEPTNGEEETDRDARSPKIHQFSISRPLINSDFAKEVKTKLHDSTNLDEILNETDRHETLAEESAALVETFDSSNELLKVLKATADRIVSSRLAIEDKDKAELIAERNKYQSLLQIKREQVSSLRTVLRLNKTNNEGALKSVQSKYKSEMQIKDEAITQLRKELKQFKEDAATFASNRAMYTAAQEELRAQNEQLREKLKLADEEKTMLNQLLRMAIQQKLAAVQRVDELEVDRERSSQGAKRPIRPQAAVPQREVRAVRYPQSGANNGNSSPRNGNQTSPRSK